MSIATKNPRTKHQRIDGSRMPARNAPTPGLPPNHPRRARSRAARNSNAIPEPTTNATAGQKSSHMRGMLS